MTIANLNRTVGLEIEVNSHLGRDDAANAINTEFHNRNIVQNCVAEGYNHTTRRHWKVVPDSSLSSGFEVVAPPLTLPEMKVQLQAVCAALKTLGVRVTTETGIHVHHDVRDLTGQQIGRAFAIYATFQNELSMMVAPSRRRAYYAQPLSWERITENGTDKFQNDRRGYDGIEDKIRQRVGGRYMTVNIEAVFAHGTIEFRQHQGSLAFHRCNRFSGGKLRNLAWYRANANRHG